jgi:signal transduction histidine kinase
MPSPGGRVQVTLTTDTQGVRVSVHDNGPGIAPSQHKLVFERFHQIQDDRHRPQGTGLGLPISRQIVEHFGGRIRVDADAGPGACLVFELPWNTMGSVAPPSSAASAPAAQQDRADPETH